MKGARSPQARERAVHLLALGKSIAETSRLLKIDEKTIDRWKRNDPEFQMRLEELLNRWAAAIEKKGIADKRRRLFRLNDRWRRGQAFIEKRAKKFRELVRGDPNLANVPGGEDGMVAWKRRTIHTGNHCYEQVIEYEWDAGLSADMRAIEEQAAMELGQWNPKHEISFSDTDRDPIRVQYLSVLTDDELSAFLAIARKLNAAGPGGGNEPPQLQPYAKAASRGTAPLRGVPEAP